MSDRFEHEVMRDAVEGSPDVKINDPVLLPAPFPRDHQGIQSGTPRTVAVAVGMKDRLKLLLQHDRHRCLRHPVCHVGHPKQTHPGPMIFRYLHRPSNDPLHRPHFLL